MFVWLENIVIRFLYSFLNLSEDLSRVGSLEFFLYDFFKIIILLIIITHFMTFLNTYLPFEKIKKYLSENKFRGFEYLFASLFGAITPFCSCSSIPLFVGFLKAWIPLSLTFTFLITSPLINEVAIALFLWMFWIKVTVVYVLSGMFLWIVWGFILWKLKLEKFVADFVRNSKNNWNQWFSEEIKKPFKDEIKRISKEAFSIVKKITPYVFIWIMIWAIIHWYVPEGFFQEYIKANNPLAVPLAVILAIPIYSNAAWAIPIVQSLIAKWIPLWTWLAFMMAIVGLSLPEFLILKKVMKFRLLFIFFGLVGFFMIVLWYIFNFIF